MDKSKVTLILLILILIYSIIYNNLWATSGEKADNLLEEAKNLIVSGNISEAIIRINQAIELNPFSSYAYFMLGNAYYAGKEYGRAIEHFKTAIKYNSDYGEAYYNLGRAYCHQNDKENGKKYLNKAKELFAVQNLPDKYEKCLKLLIEISSGESLNSYKEELEKFKNHGLPPTPTPTITPVPTSTCPPTITPSPTLTPTITPTPVPVGIKITDVTTFKGIKKIAFKPDDSITVIIDDRPFESAIIKEEDSVYTGVLDLFYYTGYEVYYDLLSENIIVEGEILPREFFRVDDKRKLYISLEEFCNYKQFTYIFNENYSRKEIKIYTKYQKAGSDDFLYYIIEGNNNPDIVKERPVVYVNGITDGGTFHIFDSYFRLNLADGSEYYFQIKPQTVYSGENYSSDYKLLEFIRQELKPVSVSGLYTTVDVFTYRNFAITFYDPRKGTIRITILYTIYEGQWSTHQYIPAPDSEPTEKPPNWYFDNPVQYPIDY